MWVIWYNLSRIRTLYRIPMLTQSCVWPSPMTCSTGFTRGQGGCVVCTVLWLVCSTLWYCLSRNTQSISFIKKLIEDNCSMDETIRFLAVSSSELSYGSNHVSAYCVLYSNSVLLLGKLVVLNRSHQRTTSWGKRNNTVTGKKQKFDLFPWIFPDKSSPSLWLEAVLRPIHISTHFVRHLATSSTFNLP